ncbi:MAG TPA: sigma-70 family RNA polymerase sigma factor [Candidatus Didemnitutus sp.]|nr:sigma-70 family RNA polymerase sigma factor [Candidatus Didemnitutus sp.]
MAEADELAEREAALLARSGQGDRVAFREFYDLVATPLHSLALRMMGNAEDAEDMLQEAFVKMWRYAASYDGHRARPFTWAVTVLRNTCIDHLRQRRSRPVVVPLPDAAEESPVLSVGESVRRGAERGEAVQAVRTALGGFAANQRGALEMALFSGLTHAEIAQRLGQPAGTVKSWIRRGLLNLRETLAESGT